MRGDETSTSRQPGGAEGVANRHTAESGERWKHPS